MLLLEILKDVNYICTSGLSEQTGYMGDIEVNEIRYDSRRVEHGDVFVAINGFEMNGHEFIDKAINNGATVIVYSDDMREFRNGVCYMRVTDTRKAMAVMSKNRYHAVREQLDNTYIRVKHNPFNIIGITGTNGKTTTAHMVKHVLEHSDKKVGMIGTIANYIGSTKIETERTTPESVDLFRLLHQMESEGCDYCVMEVSSHSSELDRIYGVPYSAGAFTNLTQDHMDFHKTFENYYNAKFKFMNSLERPCINIDDVYGQRMMLELQEVGRECVSYGVNGGDIRAVNLKLSSECSTFDVMDGNSNLGTVRLHIPGLYNVYNALSVIALLYKSIGVDRIIKAFDVMENVAGRCERIYHPKCEATVVVDYAHSPDGLENILKTMKDVCTGRLITVFGCGGDRDKTKRPMMGRIASLYSDITVVTSDNPRTENPTEIIHEILDGVTGEHCPIEDRKAAIEFALLVANKDDIVVIAGKGHEDYQIIGTKKHHFSDKEVIVGYFESKE